MSICHYVTPVSWKNQEQQTPTQTIDGSSLNLSVSSNCLSVWEDYTEFFRFFDQSDEELKRREEEERAQLELRERQMFHQRLRQQRLESEADSKWLQQEEQNIELPFSPVHN